MRRADQWVVGLAAGAVSIGLWVYSGSRSRDVETPNSGSAQESAEAPTLAGSGRLGQRSTQVSDRTLGLFARGRPQLRANILQDLLRGGIYDARLVPVLTSMITDSSLDEWTRFLAQVMYTRTTGDDVQLRALARTALGEPQKYRGVLEDSFGDCVDLVLLAATRRPPEGAGDAVSVLQQALWSPQALRETVRVALRDAEGARLAWALEFARAFRPPPEELATAARRGMESSDVTVQRETLRVLAHPGWGERDDRDMLAECAARTMMTSPDLTSLALDALSSLRQGGPLVQQALMTAVRDGSTRSQALRTVESLGPLAAGIAPPLLEWARGVDEVDRIALDRALASLGSSATATYLETRLRAGDESESVAILDRLSEFPGSLALVPVVKELAYHLDTRAGRSAVAALVRMDRRLELPGNESVLLFALRANEAVTQLAVLAALRALEAPGAEIARLTFSHLGSIDPEVVRSAAIVVREWGKQAAAWYVLRGLAEEACGADSKATAEAVGVGLELLARMDPTGPALRVRLRAALQRGRAVSERLGALRAYLSVMDPSADEARLVATQLGTNELIDAASAVLDLRTWTEVMEREQIPRMVQRATPFR